MEETNFGCFILKMQTWRVLFFLEGGGGLPSNDNRTTATEHIRHGLYSVHHVKSFVSFICVMSVKTLEFHVKIDYSML